MFQPSRGTFCLDWASRTAPYVDGFTIGDRCANTYGDYTCCYEAGGPYVPGTSRHLPADLPDGACPSEGNNEYPFETNLPVIDSYTTADSTCNQVYTDDPGGMEVSVTDGVPLMTNVVTMRTPTAKSLRFLVV